MANQGWGPGNSPFPTLSTLGAPHALGCGFIQVPLTARAFPAASQHRLLQGRSEMVDSVLGHQGWRPPPSARLLSWSFSGQFSGNRVAACPRLHVLNTSHPCFWFTGQEDSSDDLTASRVLLPDAPSYSGIREQPSQDCLAPEAAATCLLVPSSHSGNTGLEFGPRITPGLGRLPSLGQTHDTRSQWTLLLQL